MCLGLIAMKSEIGIVQEINPINNENHNPKVNKANAQFTKKSITPSKLHSANQNFLLQMNLMTEMQ